MTDKWWKDPGVAGEIFDTKKALEQRIRDINKAASLDTPLAADDQNFLIAVLQHHYQWVEKRGAGISHLEIRLNSGHGYKPTRGIWIVRADGTAVDISWVVALKPGGESSPKENVLAAARREIESQIVECRNSEVGQDCPVCGEPLVDGLHVDHRSPRTFDKLFGDWMADRSHTFEAIEVEDFGLYALFEDRGVAEDWQKYHCVNADLRLVHAEENLTRIVDLF